MAVRDRISSGVSAFVVGECTVKTFFPIDLRGNVNINCCLCRFFSKQSGMCQLTKQISEYPDKYIGSHCPLDFSEDTIINEKENKNETV